MRAICLALLAINILALSIQLFIGAPDLSVGRQAHGPATGEHDLVLLAERSGTQATSVPRPSRPAAESDRSSEHGQKGALCELIGPFGDSDRAEHLDPFAHAQTTGQTQPQAEMGE